MEGSVLDPEEIQDVVAGTSTQVAASTTSALAPQMMSQLFKKQPLVEQRLLPKPECESNRSSPSTSPKPVSTNSVDKTDNRDPLALYPEDLNMFREEDRLKTFAKWPVPFISTIDLAKNGFYFLGRRDEIRCAFCNVELMTWREGDDPAQDHKRWAPQCPFVKGQVDIGNVPSNRAASSGHDECGLREPNTSAAPVRMSGPVHTAYATEAARLRSFTHWPRTMGPKPEQLAEAGFFYTGQDDKAKCFYCDGGLKDWENDDQPWEEHARWFSRCAFVQLLQGPEYVKKVLAAAPSAEDPKEKDASNGVAASPETANASPPKEGESSAQEDTTLCKICFNEERNVCFVPCGHVVACAKCALSSSKCPMCRRSFTNVVRLYFS